jgi:hypothetical protein
MNSGFRTAVENPSAPLVVGDLKPLFDILASDEQWIEAKN